MGNINSIDEFTLCPWNRGEWSGTFISLDGATATDFTRSDVYRVVDGYESADDWDGESIGIVELVDHRFVV